MAEITFGWLCNEVLCADDCATREQVAGARRRGDDHPDTQLAHSMLTTHYRKQAAAHLQRIREQPGAERILAICRDELGDASEGDLRRLGDRLSVRLDREPSEVFKMTLPAFLAAWKGRAVVIPLAVKAEESARGKRQPPLAWITSNTPDRDCFTTGNVVTGDLKRLLKATDSGRSSDLKSLHDDRAVFVRRSGTKGQFECYFGSHQSFKQALERLGEASGSATKR